VTSIDEPLRGLFIQHQDDVPAGLIGERAEQRGVLVDVLHAAPGRYPQPDGYDFVVPLGSGASAYDDAVPWIHDERAFLRAAVAADVPVFGICFGSQILSQVLGGEVRRGAEPEIGWLAVQTDEPGLVEAGPWLVWHFDVFTPPPGARVLARTALGPQAFVAGRHFGVQFHPEATPDSVASWAEAYADTVQALGSTPEQLVLETRALLPAARRRAHRLFDRFLDHARVGVLRRDAS
jgi:GMP synthase (glutamine-hydrolysing)